jgi:hypothetical protein
MCFEKYYGLWCIVYGGMELLCTYMSVCGCCGCGSSLARGVGVCDVLLAGGGVNCSVKRRTIW